LTKLVLILLAIYSAAAQTSSVGRGARQIQFSLDLEF